MLVRSIGHRQSRLSKDAIFSAYAEIYKSLDTIMWQNIATLLAVTAFGFNAIATIVKDHVRLFGLSNQSITGIMLIIMGLIYVVTIYTMYRFRIHHLLMDAELAKLEGYGYFAKRSKEKSRKISSAPLWNSIAFGGIATACLIGGVVELSRGDWLWIQP